MFFDQLDERNAMLKSILAFEEVGLVSLADLEWLVQHLKSRFLCPSANYNHPSLFSGRLDDRNMLMKSIMHSRQFWVSTYAPFFLVKLAY